MSSAGAPSSAPVGVAGPARADVPRSDGPVRRAIPFGFLVGVYLAVPLCLLLQALDALWWGGVLRIDPLDETAPSVWAYVGMGLPHVVVSSVMLVSNADYLRRFGRRVVGTTLVILGFFAVAARLPYEVAFAALGVATVTHVFLQQMGVGRAFCRCEPTRYAAWTWTSVLVGCLLYNRVYLAASLGPTGRLVLDVAVAVAAAASVVAAWACDRTVASGRGRVFLWANVALVLCGVYLHAVGWAFLALLAPRIVHDVTAFGFYAVHDHNRHAGTPANGLFRATRRLRIPPVVVAPALGMLLTVAVAHVAEPALAAVVTAAGGEAAGRPLALYLVIFLMLMHYSTEAVTWRRGSPYRAFVPVA